MPPAPGGNGMQLAVFRCAETRREDPLVLRRCLSTALPIIRFSDVFLPTAIIIPHFSAFVKGLFKIFQNYFSKLFSIGFFWVINEKSSQICDTIEM